MHTSNWTCTCILHKGSHFFLNSVKDIFSAHIMEACVCVCSHVLLWSLKYRSCTIGRAVQKTLKTMCPVSKEPGHNVDLSFSALPYLLRT
jgi:hypothetical protein